MTSSSTQNLKTSPELNTASYPENSNDLPLRETYETVLAAFFLIVTLATAVIGNLAVILVICLQRSLRKDISNLLIINLSVTDLSNALFVMVSALTALISDDWKLGRIWCDFICAINYCLIIVSMLTLFCISIDRYHAVLHPMSYTLRITRRRMLAVIAYTWLQGITFGIAPSISGWVEFDYWEAICAIQWHLYRPNTIIYVVLAFLLCFLLPGMGLIYCYSKILKEVKKQKIQVKATNYGDTRTREHNKKNVDDRSKLVWSLLVVVFAYFICTTPFSVTKLIKVIANKRDIIPGPVNLVSALLGYVASAINPLIYGIFRRDFRKAYKKLLYSMILVKHFRNDTSPTVSTAVGTISRADNLTINHDETNISRRLESALEELKNAPENLPNGTSENHLTPHLGKQQLIVPTNQKVGDHSQQAEEFLDVFKEKIGDETPPGSIVSCRQVMVKSVFDSTDTENE